MPSLLDEPYADPGQSGRGLLGLDMPRIAAPTDTDQGAALGDLYQRIMAEQAAQRAKQWRRQNGMPSVVSEMLANMPPTTARVPPDTLSDINRTAGFAPVDVGNEVTSPIYPSNDTQLVDRLINYDAHGQSFNYAQAIQRAMDIRQRLGRGG